MASYERALRYRPDYAEVHSNLGNVLMAQGKYTEAAASHGRALTHKPDYAEAHNNLGLVLLEQGNVDAAVASYRRALTHKPAYAEAHNNLGNALREQGQSAEAAASYQRALVLDRDNTEARLGLATATIPVFADTVADSVAAAEKFARSLDELTAWSSANPGKLGKSVGGSQPFYLAYRPVDVTALLSRYGDLVCAEAAAYWQSGSAAGGSSSAAARAHSHRCGERPGAAAPGVGRGAAGHRGASGSAAVRRRSVSHRRDDRRRNNLGKRPRRSLRARPSPDASVAG